MNARAILVLFRVYALGFAVVLGAVGYWKLVRGDELATHPRNPRYWEGLRTRQRGTITDVDKQELAISVPVGETAGRRTLYAREYQAGKPFGHAIGYSNLKIGEAGVEMGLNEQLLALDSPPPEPRSLQQFFWRLLVPPAPRGNDVRLTIDRELQQRAYELLNGRKGAVVAIDVRDGRILCLADWPSFDPATVVDDWAKLNQAENHPLLARAYQGRYPPGSVFKVMTAAAALQAGVVSPETMFVCEGRKRYAHSTVYCHDRSGHGRLSLREGVAKSCNIVFADTALALGAERFAAVCDAAGLESRPGIYFPGDDPLGVVAKGNLPAVDELTPQMLAACGYGQGELLVTPLWVASLGQMIGNHGARHEPRLVEAVTAPSGKPWYQFKPAAGQQVVASPVATEVLRMMGGVMAPGGTGSHLAVSGLRLGGKTGSAENPHGQAHSWFLAIGPLESPRVAVAVVIENGGYGGRAAGPVAVKVLREALARDG